MFQLYFVFFVEICRDIYVIKPQFHDNVIKWKHFPRYWPFVQGIHQWPMNFPHKGQRRGALMFSLICALNKRMSKRRWGWWFETPSRSLWRHCNVNTFQIIMAIIKLFTFQVQCIRCLATNSGVTRSVGEWWLISYMIQSYFVYVYFRIITTRVC